MYKTVHLVFILLLWRVKFIWFSVDQHGYFFLTSFGPALFLCYSCHSFSLNVYTYNCTYICMYICIVTLCCQNVLTRPKYCAGCLLAWIMSGVSCQYRPPPPPHQAVTGNKYQILWKIRQTNRKQYAEVVTIFLQTCDNTIMFKCLVWTKSKDD